jgi:DNA polymerase-2
VSEAPIVIFLLTREAQQRSDGLEIVLWGRSEEGPVRVRLTRREAVFFVERDVPTELGRRREVDLRTLEGVPVDAVYFTDRRDLRAETERLRRRGTPPFEADVKPADRVLMERFVTGACVLRGRAQPRDGFLELVDPRIDPADVRPDLVVSSFDVEAEGPDAELISVAIVTGREERAFVRGQGPPIDGVAYLRTEAEALRAFLDHVRAIDPDVLIGWNVIDFDLAYLEERCAQNGVRFELGRDRERAKVIRGSTPNAPSVARVPGRVVLDGIATMRAATWSFESWSLENVGRALLGRGKKIEEREDGDALTEILRMAREDLPALIEYNLEDCRLVRDIFEKAHVLEFAIERQRLTGLGMERRAGAVAAFDHLYLPRLHRHGRVAPTSGMSADALASPGGYVMDSVPGLYENVLVLDFKSLYPSIIRTFLVDPLGLAVGSPDADRRAIDRGDTVEGFAGARFSRTEHILPGLIEGLWSARDDAKAKGDAALQRAIKILMNSFYGVLGTPACRFFDPRLPSSITRRGHEILLATRAFLEERGHPVIYGDTDSVFVHLGPGHTVEACHALGEELALTLNGWWRERIEGEHGLESALELELDACFSRFLMPTMRRSEQGSKKRYAGIVVSDGETKLVIKGLEAVRTDWTPLARSFQRELLRRVFAEEPYEAWVRELTDALHRGELDEECVYKKRLRRPLDEYTKNVPPHVAAARQLPPSPSGLPRREVHYVITTRGPQPASTRTAPIDYVHYVERQLAPAADAVLPFLGADFMKLGGRQMSLF